MIRKKVFIFRNSNNFEDLKFLFDREFKKERFYKNKEGIIHAVKNEENDKSIQLNVCKIQNRIYVINDKKEDLKFNECKYVIGELSVIKIFEEFEHVSKNNPSIKYYYKTIELDGEKRIILTSSYERDLVYILMHKDFRIIE